MGQLSISIELLSATFDNPAWLGAHEQVRHMLSSPIVHCSIGCRYNWSRTTLYFCSLIG